MKGVITAQDRDFARTWGVALGLGAAHFVVDASSNFVMARLLAGVAHATVLLLAYNGLAFALQPVVAALLDARRWARVGMGVGTLMTAAAMLAGNGWAALVMTGLGNALFHVGAGTWVAQARPGRASLTGLFIGPGAVGVVVGAVAAPWASWPILLALSAFAPLGMLLPDSAADPAPGRPARHATIGALLLLAITLRSLMAVRAGLAFARFDWVLPLACAACTGKMLGGLLADRWGWRRTAVIALALSAAFLPVGRHHPWFAATGVLCFQAVTSISLAGLYRLYPAHIGLCFGLACLALFIGVLPALLPFALPFDSATGDLALTIAAATALWWGLAEPRRVTEATSSQAA